MTFPKSLRTACIALCLLLAGLLGGCSDTAETKKATPGGMPADYTLMDGPALQGMVREVSASGRGVLLAFWTTWCPGCRQELPELIKLRTMYPEDKLAMTIVSLDEEEKVIRDFFEKEGLPGFPVLHGTRDAATAYQVNAIPHLLLVAPDGRILFNQAGAFPAGMLQKVVDQAVR